MWEKENEKSVKREKKIYKKYDKFNISFDIREERKTKEIC
jgi:hypothetical protein